MTAPPAPAITLSLVSHTNAGKTSLARTLLGRDIGEVRDAPHVTEFAEMHVLLRSAEGDELRLWDTPGFGDTPRLLRLVRRLRQADQPLGWLLGQLWDRWRDRPFWASQQALRHVRDESSVVLYLVSAAESPAAASYVDAEMELLAWVAKPVIVLLNQLGAPRAAADEAADVERWRTHLQPLARVHAVLPMDAFARCWVQEGALYRAVGDALAAAEPARSGGVAAPMQRLLATWAAQRLATFDAAMAELAASLGRIAATHAPLADKRWLQRRQDAAAAHQGLADALDAEVRASTGRLLQLHGLHGQAEREIIERVATQVQVRQRVGEGFAALLGGALSGAATGLHADIATGGLTLGGGMLAGGVLGALGAAGLARGLNVVRGAEQGFASWSSEAMPPLVQAALLRYLAVAHFGRGRGDWSQGEAPPHWRDVAAAALAPQQPALDALWRSRASRFDNAGEPERLAAALAPLVAQAGRDALERLYPGAWPAPAPAG